MSILAVIAVTLAAGAWLGIRIADAKARIETDIAAYVLALPVAQWEDEQ